METERKENVLAGLIGAFLGSLLGAACIVGIGQLGYVAAFSGLIMAVCAVKGYELLGGAVSRKGAVIACVLIAVMTYFGNRLDFAVSVARLADTDVFTAFRAMGALLDEGYLNPAAYWGNLALLYLFTLVGAVPTLIAAFRRASPAAPPPESRRGPEAPSEPPAQLYPFAGLSWTRSIRLSLALPLLLPLAVVIALCLRYEGSPSIPVSLAVLGAGVGMLGSAVWMLALLAPFQSVQYVFVRTNRELWRVDLARLNGIEPYRFTRRSGSSSIRGLRWEILNEEERQRAGSAMERAIRSIRAGEVMPDSVLRRVVRYIPDPRLETETKWTWKISYALHPEAGGRRKTMTIGKVYPDFTPTPDAAPPEGPVPVRWNWLVIPLAVTLLLAAVGWAAGAALTGQPAGRQDGADLTAFRPESFVFYERGGVRFRVDSSFQMDEEAGRLTDPDTGTEYFLEVQTGADQTLALDRLLEPVSQYRMDDAFQGFSFAYPSAEEDLAALSAEDGALYRHNLLTVRFTDGRVIQNAVSLSDGGLLIRVMAVQGGADSEEAVTGMIQYLLTTLKPVETAG